MQHTAPVKRDGMNNGKLVLDLLYCSQKYLKGAHTLIKFLCAIPRNFQSSLIGHNFLFIDQSELDNVRCKI